MQKSLVLVATILGGALGVWYFMARRNPPAGQCWRAGRFTRQMLFTAVLVAGLLSYVSAVAVKLVAGEVNQKTNAVPNISGTTTNAFTATREWQDLKVFWNIITGDPKFFRETNQDQATVIPGQPIIINPDFGSDRISQWKAQLLTTALNHRLSELDQLERRGMISPRLNLAVHKLFQRMLAHFNRSNSGFTCYMPMPGSRSGVGDIASLMEQSRQLRIQYQKGVLSNQVVRDLAIQLTDKLEVLDVLTLYPEDVISEKEIVAQMNPWRKVHDPRGKKEDFEVRRAIVTKLLEKKELSSPVDQPDPYLRSWRQERDAMVSLVVELNRYQQDSKVEKTLKGEVLGSVGTQRLLDLLSKAERAYEKSVIIDGLGEKKATVAIRLLKGLLNDDAVAYVGRSDGNKSSSYFVEYPIRQSAARALSRMGVDKKEDEVYYPINSVEARIAVKKALLSKDALVRKSAVDVIGSAKVPSLTALLPKNESEKENSSISVEQIMRRVESKEIDLLSAQYELGHIGNDEAIAILGDNALNSPDSYIRYGAIYVLSNIKSPKVMPILLDALKDPVSKVRFEAARILTRKGRHEAFAVLEDYLVNGDEWENRVALTTLKDSNDPAAKAILKKHMYGQ